jgi:sialate O-acetylesterase
VQNQSDQNHDRFLANGIVKPTQKNMPKLRFNFTGSLMCGLGILLSTAATIARADVKLPAIFSDHMVLQRDVAVPVWGWAEPSEVVTVSIAGQTKIATADAAGKWSVKLDKLAAGETLTMVVSGKNKLTVNDVLVGEVWLASGQSNMQMWVKSVQDLEKEKAAAKFPQLRMFTVTRHEAVTPQTDCEGKWVLCSPETVETFSATAYFFGRELHQKLGLPVGFINASVGATPIEGWTSMEKMEGKKELAPVFNEWAAKLRVPFDPVKEQAKYEKQLASFKVSSAKRVAEGKPAGYAPAKPVPAREDKNYPGNLFNGMIAPVIPYAIRGGIWYQGENSGRAGFAQLYEYQLPLLIADWRERWGQGAFPFAWVQLANYREYTNSPSPVSHWARVRDGMLKSLAVTNTGMAVAIDIGEADNIHPKNKQEVGRRLGLWARATVYGEKIPFSGPLPAGHKINGDKIILSFTHTDGGLMAVGGELSGFVIAGADKKWHWAKARIEGEQVIVSSEEVKKPVAVRYAWADNPKCNLYNGAGLPASPFRTDAW